MSIRQLFAAFLVLLFLIQAIIPAPAVAEGSASPADAAGNHTFSLDLTSTDRSVATPRSMEAPVTIQVGGDTKLVGIGEMLTPAERVAVHQVISTGQQSIQLGALGDAVGGSFNLSARFSQHISNLVIPEGVTAIADFSKSAVMTFAGSLTNGGALYAVSNSGQNSATFSAVNIFNLPQSVITSNLLGSGLPSLPGAVENLNLTLLAAQNIVNQGIISSAGTLSLTAGGTISNGSAASAILQAASNLNLQAAGIVNQGQIFSQVGNVNVMTAQLNSSGDISAKLGSILISSGGLSNLLTVEALNGTLSALNRIAVGNQLGERVLDLTVSGGKWLAPQIDFNAGTGVLVASLGQTSGAINVRAGCAAVELAKGDLNIGRFEVSGDPSFLAHDGSIDLGNLALSFTSTVIEGVPTQVFFTNNAEFVAVAAATYFGVTMLRL